MVMTEIRVGKNESLDSALRRFVRSCKKVCWSSQGARSESQVCAGKEIEAAQTPLVPVGGTDVRKDRLYKDMKRSHEGT